MKSTQKYTFDIVDYFYININKNNYNESYLITITRYTPKVG